MPRTFDEVQFDIPISIAWSDLSGAWRASTTIGGEPIYGNTAGNPVAAMTNLFAQLVHTSDDLLAGMERRVNEAAKGRTVLQLDPGKDREESSPSSSPTPAAKEPDKKP